MLLAFAIGSLVGACVAALVSRAARGNYVLIAACLAAGIAGTTCALIGLSSTAGAALICTVVGATYAIHPIALQAVFPRAKLLPYLVSCALSVWFLYFVFHRP